MEIKQLQLFSTNIDKQQHFYQEILGFKCERISDSELKVFAGENILIFQKSNRQFFYHFAFLIPTKSLEAAIQFLEKKEVEVLLRNDEMIVQFNSGRAIYFYDMDGNIAEFIERPLLHYPYSTMFVIDLVIKLNEIGLPSLAPKQLADRLVHDFGINPLNQSQFDNRFCWVGDHNGVLIVVKEGRNWLPTQTPAEVNDFSIIYSDNGKIFNLKFENNEIWEIE